MKMKSVMSHNFSQSPQADVPRSSFDRSHGIKTTFDAGYLVPIFIDEVLPGDTHKLNATLFARFATLLYPMMDNMFLDTQFFFVPTRLVWDSWQKFCGERTPNPDSSIDFTIPTVTSANTTDFNQSSIYDYFGIATKIANVEVNSLPLRAYNLIYNEWYRDENLQNGVTVSTADANDDPADFALLRRGKRYDYFTSCLPWPQKGTAVPLPLGTVAPVQGKDTAIWVHEGTNDLTLNTQSGTNFVSFGSDPGTSLGLKWGKDADFTLTGLEADLSAATAATINDLRESFQIQRFQEREARGGTRYTEILRSFFGVTSPDQRLQRPEYLGGGSSPLVVTPVAQTSGTGQTGQNTPQANLSAYGTVTCMGNGFIKSFVEHGYIIGLASVRADLNYQQGTHRLWNRSERFDFYWPVFSHLGEQPVIMKELYTLGTAADNNVFGYQEAWADYRYKMSVCTGLFRSNATGTLDAWHLAQELSSPSLNATFIQENPPTTRVKATSGDPDFVLDGYINLISVRPMPTYSVPGLIDHF